MSVDDNKRVVQRVVDEVFNGRNPAMVDELYGPCGAREHVREHAAMLQAAFADLLMTPEDVVGEGELVATRFTASGTQTGAFQGRPPTGIRLTWRGLTLSRVVAGRIVEEWHALDPEDLQRMGGRAPASAHATG
jgi:predicted ester cyclase